MAQAARLNLRLQKELKLLMADPPPGVSLPALSDNPEQSLLSLLSMEAYIKGPEETVYYKGIFTIKIQIPERYPFQPPNVTFVTPIYHPNIDNGGRICLDILNIPPKGAWQPSMNISTVLTSIRLLLSEPNPDDALMAEISREFKYNAHVFKQKAIAWTERFANPDSTRKSDDHAVLTSLNVAPLEVGRVNIPENPAKVSDRTRKKLHLTCQNVPAKSMMATGLNTDEKENMVHVREILDKKLSSASSELLQHYNATVDKKSLNDLVETFVMNNPKQVAADGSSSPENPVKQSDRTRKKLRLSCQKLSANQLMHTAKNHNDIKDNVEPTQDILDKQSSSCSELQNSGVYFEKQSLHEHEKNALIDNPKQVEVSPEFLESIIVSDSEESDDEDNRPSRLRLSFVEPNVGSLE